MNWKNCWMKISKDLRADIRAGEKMFGTGKRALLAQVPLLTAMIIISFISLSIMHLDMNMRPSMM